MSAWAIVAVAGAVLGVLIIVLLVVVSRAVVRTAQNASELLVALEEVRAKTLVLAELDGHGERMAGVVSDAASTLEQLRDGPVEGDGHEASGR